MRACRLAAPPRHQNSRQGHARVRAGLCSCCACRYCSGEYLAAAPGPFGGHMPPWVLRCCSHTIGCALQCRWLQSKPTPPPRHSLPAPAALAVLLGVAVPHSVVSHVCLVLEEARTTCTMQTLGTQPPAAPDTESKQAATQHRLSPGWDERGRPGAYRRSCLARRHAAGPGAKQHVRCHDAVRPPTVLANILACLASLFIHL